MINGIDNDTACVCLRLLDKHTPPAARPYRQAERVNLAALRRAGFEIGRREAAQICKPPAGRANSNYGKTAAVAREYLSRPRFHGEMSAMARSAGVKLTSLSAMVGKLQRERLRRDAA